MDIDIPDDPVDISGYGAGAGIGCVCPAYTGIGKSGSGTARNPTQGIRGRPQKNGAGAYLPA